MKATSIIACAGVVLLCAGLYGCSVSASASYNSEGKAVLTGDDSVLVKAAQPEPPPPPPPPPPPKPVAKKAKVVGKKIEITEKVMFEYNKATIKEESHDLLNDVAKVMKAYPNITKIHIEGHTDSDGSARYNKKLSQKRADSVMQFLVDAGVEAGRMEAIGYGEEKPVADNDSKAGKEKNRRVEFNITEQKETLVEVTEAGETETAEPEGE